VAIAGAGDCVVIAGKGHEDYQLVAGARLPFSDEAHARAALARRTAT
jgi:UDP-N-acetylmuramoyl-L-alanyl-D-glutamate--2,6-diaminopimelate ligase